MATSGYPWTEREEDVLKKHYGNESAKEVAARLPGRSLPAVYQAAVKYGVTKGRWEERGYRIYRDSVKWGHYRSKNNGCPSWNLSKAEFLHLVQRPCHYCGAPPQRREVSESSTRKKFVIFASGLDRIDSDGAYSIDNVVPCCTLCNTAKSDMTVSEFREWVERIHQHFVTGEQDAE